MLEAEIKIDEAFAHLQELMDALPRMQKQGERLARARAAKEVLSAARRLAFDRDVLEEYERLQETAAEAADKARAEGCDEAEVQDREKALLYFGAMRGFKVGPVANGEKALADALAAGGFADEDDARAAALSDDELRKLADEVAAYQADYAVTLELCQKLEGEAVDDEGDVAKD